MRLLHVHTLEFRQFERDPPRYAIASHRWPAGQEATIEDVRNRHGRITNKSGYKKIQGFAEYVRKHIPHVDWLWIDTCCVNQDSSQEVTEAVNSMFRWYAGAEVCLAYLVDISDTQDELQRSEWFTRGWTLQELLAPHIVVFLSQKWDAIGYKGGGGWTKSGFRVSSGSLESTIATITKIPEEVLYNYNRSKSYNVEERLAWIYNRRTTKEEDMSYSLLGIFDVTMPVIYGEGAKKARRRFLEEISKTNTPHQDPMPYPIITPARAGSEYFPQDFGGQVSKAACSTDLLFLIDTTSSMTPYIDAVKQQVRSIVADIQEAFFDESTVWIAVVSYRDHSHHPNIEFLDFTTSVDEVSDFLDRISARREAGTPGDVLGGIHQALQASWNQQTRCLIHITDSPSHGSSLHDLPPSHDSYYSVGSEPHGLTYERLLKRLIKLEINYVMLRINSLTDRMVLQFAGVYEHENSKLFSCNSYYSQVHLNKSSGSELARSTKHLALEPQLEESQLGTMYSELQHLVVQSVTNLAPRTADRLSLALSTEQKHADERLKERFESVLASIPEDETTVSYASITRTKGDLEKVPPQWTKPGWFDERLEVEGFIPAAIVHNAHTLGDIMSGDEYIKLTVATLTIYARSKPFAKGATRLASYARTSASTNKFVIKSFIEAGHSRADMVEAMRMQALCKAFALEFNGFLKVDPPLDFLVTSCLQTKPTASVERGNECLSLEPYIDGEYVKYNNNAGYVNEELSDDRFNQIAQAFSHFTFERSWGYFLVNDLQGVGHLLTNPSIQTRNDHRFPLNDTNLHEDGFKFFFATHTCNSFCHQLGLKSNGRMFISGDWKFSERWPVMEPNVYCSNMLCRSIILLASARKSDRYPGYYWCTACWAQLQGSTTRWLCAEPGRDHKFDVSRFFYESQGQLPPRKCPDHRKRDPTRASAAEVDGGLWSKLKKSKAAKDSISSKS